MHRSIEELIRASTQLGTKTASGFEGIKCPLCSDYKERAGFKIDEESIFFSCFNCNEKAFHKKSSAKANPKMRKLLSALMISDHEIDLALGGEFISGKPLLTVKPQVQSKYPSKISLPKGSVKLEDAPEDWRLVITDYLTSRCLPVSSAYYSPDESMLGRVIFPYFFKGEIIYWQARALLDEMSPRYKNPVMHRDNIFYNMDELQRYTDQPIILTEGLTDALMFGDVGVSIAGSVLSEFKKQELRKTNRRKIFLIDKNLPGLKLGQVAIANGWSIVVFPAEISDANDCVKKMGKLWTLNYVLSSAKDGVAATLELKMLEAKIQKEEKEKEANEPRKTKAANFLLDRKS